MAPVGQAGERVTFTLHLQQGLAAPQLLVGPAGAPHLEHQHPRGQREHQRGQHPDTLDERLVLQASGLEAVLALGQRQVAPARLGTEALLQLREHGLAVEIVDLPAQPVGPVEMVEGGRRIADVGQRIGRLIERQLDAGTRLGLLPQADGRLEISLALGHLADAQARQAAVVQQDGLAPAVVEAPHHRQCPLHRGQRVARPAGAQVVVAQRGQHQGLPTRRRDAARQGERTLERRAAALAMGP